MPSQFMMWTGSTTLFEYNYEHFSASNRPGCVGLCENMGNINKKI